MLSSWAPARQGRWRAGLTGLLVTGAVGGLLAAERGMSASASGSWWGLLLLEVRAVGTDLRTQWAVDPRTAAWVQRLCVQERDREDFEWLLRRGGWEGKPWRVWLEHVGLAAYNRRLVAWKIPDEMYRAWVLNPWLSYAARGDVGWRWPLWERLYPRVDDVDSLRAAAALVVYYLRSRVGWVSNSDPAGDRAVLESLRAGRGPEAAFHRLCVAGLRSVGIPARLDAAGEAEFWDGQKWEPVGAWLPVRRTGP